MSEGPKWMVLYEVLSEMKPGDRISNDDMIALVGKNFRAPLKKAAEEFLANDRRALKSVRGFGYRVVEAGEHAGIAEGFHRKATSAVRKGVNVVTFVRRDELTDSERAHNDFAEIMMTRVSRALIAMGREIDETRSETRETRERLERLEEFVGAPKPVEAKIVDIA